MSVEVASRLYTEKSLLSEFETRKHSLYEKFSTKRIDSNDPDFVWMWELIQGHYRGQSKTNGAYTFRLTKRQDIYLVDATGAPLKDGRGKWVHVGKDGLVKNRFRTSDVAPLRQKVFKVMRDLVSDQVHQVRVDAGACGLGKDLHVGHGFGGSDPFGAMVVNFLKENGWPSPVRVEDLSIERVSSNSGSFKLSGGADLEKKWQEYHRKHSNMQMQESFANLSDNYNNKRKLWEVESREGGC